MRNQERFTIEMGRGATYCNGRWTVYRHTTYPRHSVLAGQPCRTFIDSYDSLELARAAYPQARVLDNGGTTYMPPDLTHLSDREDY